ncbi:hypothetical protein [Specibacter sp. NPDC078692]
MDVDVAVLVAGLLVSGADALVLGSVGVDVQPTRDIIMARQMATA